jgi:hypothetical protein
MWYKEREHVRLSKEFLSSIQIVAKLHGSDTGSGVHKEKGRIRENAR